MDKVRCIMLLDEKEISSIIFESISDGVFTVDKECTITSFNSAAEQLTGFSRKEAIGRFCFDIFHSNICQTSCALRNTLHNGHTIYNTRVQIITKDGKKIPISVSTTILKDQRYNQIGAVEFFRDLSEIENLQQELSKVKQFGNLISCNSKMQNIFSMLPQIAESECNVLIQGASGSGKELIAEAIHKFSPRKNKKYIRINCAALPETLLESELFGYVKGAFTDAKQDKPGLFLLAQGGTVLLDEIGEMPLSLQSKLLRVLNNGEFQPLGSTHTLRTDARIISSTNSNLEEKIKLNCFREDLYYRINVINVEIPPLIERMEDVPLLTDYFINRLQKKRGKTIEGISDEAIQILRKYKYPGNVRELENAIEHAIVMCNTGKIELEHLPQKIVQKVKDNDSCPHCGKYPRESEEAIICETLERNNGNRTRSAKELGMDRTTLWRKIKRYNMNNN